MTSGESAIPALHEHTGGYLVAPSSPEAPPVVRAIYAALLEASDAGAWGSPEHTAVFWRRVVARLLPLVRPHRRQDTAAECVRRDWTA